MKARRKIFSLSKKDFEVQTFRSGGPGGQHQNKRDTAVRITHRASGTVGTSRSERSQHRNKKLAFERLVESKSFQTWARLEAAKRLEVEAGLARRVQDQMRPWHLKIEVVGSDGEWKEEGDE